MESGAAHVIYAREISLKAELSVVSGMHTLGINSKRSNFVSYKDEHTTYYTVTVIRYWQL